MNQIGEMSKEEKDVSKLVKYLVDEKGWEPKKAVSEAKWMWNVLYTMPTTKT